MPRNNDSLARSERNGREGQRRSRGKRTERASNEAASQRPRDLKPGVDDQSAYVRATVKPTSNKAPDLDQAAMANDRSEGETALQIVKVQTKRPIPRAQDPDLSDDSSDAETCSSFSDTSSGPSAFPQPRPYDGQANQDVFDEWTFRVEIWAELNELSRKEVLRWFPQLVSGNALWCFQRYVFPSLHLRKWKLKEVFEVLQERCFPINHKLGLHRKLVSATQGNLRVLEFAGRIEGLARHLPYAEEFLAAVFYAGLNNRIRARLIFDGIYFGTVDLETLIKRAAVHESDLCRARAYGVNTIL